MPSIAELLSPHNLENVISSEISQGCVFRIHLNEEEGVKGKNSGDNGRNKYFVVLGKTQDGNLIGFLLINSNINQKLPIEVRELHYPISAKAHSFLDKDSFVDCSQIKEIKREKFSTMFDANFKKGSIKDEDMTLIIDTVKSAAQVTNKQLKKFGLL